jgi:hypothetical protein
VGSWDGDAASLGEIRASERDAVRLERASRPPNEFWMIDNKQLEN